MLIDSDKVTAALITIAIAPIINMPMIIANTIKGKGVSFMENQVSWHGKAPNEEEYKRAMEELENIYVEGGEN